MVYFMQYRFNIISPPLLQELKMRHNESKNYVRKKQKHNDYYLSIFILDL